MDKLEIRLLMGLGLGTRLTTRSMVKMREIGIRWNIAIWELLDIRTRTGVGEIRKWDEKWADVRESHGNFGWV